MSTAITPVVARCDSQAIEFWDAGVHADVTIRITESVDEVCLWADETRTTHCATQPPVGTVLISASISPAPTCIRARARRGESWSGPSNGVQVLTLDMDRSGSLTGNDATLLKRHLLGLSPTAGACD